MKYYRVNKKNKKKLKRTKMRNRRLVKKYPWIMPRYVWTGKKLENYDYSFTEWELPTGWHKAFGQMYLEELGAAVEEAGLKNEFTIYQIKDKYGRLEVYPSGASEKIYNIIDKYEHISENVCIGCGKPNVPMINESWMSPWCYDCYRKNWRRSESYASKYKKIDPSSEDEIRLAYDKASSKDHQIATSYTIRVYSSKVANRDIVYDISDTVAKINERWNKRKKNGRMH